MTSLGVNYFHDKATLKVWWSVNYETICDNSADFFEVIFRCSLEAHIFHPFPPISTQLRNSLTIHDHFNRLRKRDIPSVLTFIILSHLRLTIPPQISTHNHNLHNETFPGDPPRSSRLPSTAKVSRSALICVAWACSGVNILMLCILIVLWFNWVQMKKKELSGGLSEHVWRWRAEKKPSSDLRRSLHPLKRGRTSHFRFKIRKKMRRRRFSALEFVNFSWKFLLWIL